MPGPFFYVFLAFVLVIMLTRIVGAVIRRTNGRRPGDSRRFDGNSFGADASFIGDPSSGSHHGGHHGGHHHSSHHSGHDFGSFGGGGHDSGGHSGGGHHG